MYEKSIRDVYNTSLNNYLFFCSYIYIYIYILFFIFIEALTFIIVFNIIFCMLLPLTKFWKKFTQICIPTS
jgi:hypothetical protein